MNYIDLINHFWRLDDGAQFTGWETKLYFYLVKTANGLGWVNEFWHSDNRVSANVGMSINTMKTSRNRLKQAGLIDFVPGGKGHGNKTRYQILPPKTMSKPAQETSPENLPYVETNRKQAAGYILQPLTKEQLKTDLLDSELGRIAAKNSAIKPEEYAAAVENFVETKFGLGQDKNWKDIASAREHFIYWLPYYKSNAENRNGKRSTQKASGRQIVEQTGDDEQFVEQGADGVLRRISGKGVQTFAG